MGKALALIVVAVVTGLLVYRLAGPLLHDSARAVPAMAARDAAASTAPPREDHPASSPPTPHTDPGAGADIAPPVPSTQQARLDIEAKRAPYYQWIRSKAGENISDVTPAEDDGSVLILYVARDDGSIVSALIQDVVAPYARHYGFRHVRVFLPNPPDSVEHYRLYAEADATSDTTWITFLK